MLGPWMRGVAMCRARRRRSSHSFGAEPAADLQADNNQAAAPRALELWINTAPSPSSLAPPGAVWPSSQSRLVGGGALKQLLLARCHARCVPPSSRPTAISAFAQRRSALLTFAAARAFAASLLSLPSLAQATSMGNPQPSARSLLIRPCPRPSCTLAAAPLHRDRMSRRKTAR